MDTISDLPRPSLAAPTVLSYDMLHRSDSRHAERQGMFIQTGRSGADSQWSELQARSRVFALACESLSERLILFTPGDISDRRHQYRSEKSRELGQHLRELGVKASQGVFGTTSRSLLVQMWAMETVVDETVGFVQAARDEEVRHREDVVPRDEEQAVALLAGAQDLVHKEEMPAGAIGTGTGGFDLSYINKTRTETMSHLLAVRESWDLATREWEMGEAEREQGNGFMGFIFGSTVDEDDLSLGGISDISGALMTGLDSLHAIHAAALDFWDGLILRANAYISMDSTSSRSDCLRTTPSTAALTPSASATISAYSHSPFEPIPEPGSPSRTMLLAMATHVHLARENYQPAERSYRDAFLRLAQLPDPLATFVVRPLPFRHTLVCPAVVSLGLILAVIVYSGTRGVREGR